MTIKILLRYKSRFLRRWHDTSSHSESPSASCIISGTTQKKDTRLKWFEFSRLARPKFELPLNIINPHIATHCHFVLCDHEIVFKEKALAIALRKEFRSKSICTSYVDG